MSCLWLDHGTARLSQIMPYKQGLGAREWKRPVWLMMYVERGIGCNPVGPLTLHYRETMLCLRLLSFFALGGVGTQGTVWRQSRPHRTP